MASSYSRLGDFAHTEKAIPQESNGATGTELVSSSESYGSQSIQNDGIETVLQQQVSVVRHTISTLGLCMCTLMQAYLLISVFPYAGYMVVDLIDGINEENAGTYAGLIASAFMAGRAVSAYSWGKVADVYGRVFVLNASLILSALFSILFGTAQTFTQAMVWRFCLGLCNGIVATAKTAVTELAHGDERLERRAMGLVIGMRGWGFLISPGVGGLLAEPLTQYPDARWNQRAGIIKSLLARYPFLLPNLFGAFFCLLTAITVTCFIEETLPDDKLRSPKLILSDVYQYVSPRVLQRHTQNGWHDESQLLLSTVQSKNENGNGTSDQDCAPFGDAKSVLRRNNTRRHLIAYCMFSFVVVAIDEAFPLFCISRQGGLGLSEATIGKILSGAGLVFALCQYVVFATMVNRCGLYPSITVGSIVGVLPVMFTPFSLLLNKGVSHGVSWHTYCFLSIIMAISKIFSCLFFTSIAIAANKTVPSSQRATMNGLIMVGGSIAKGLGPTFAGMLVAFSVSSGFIPSQYGSIVIYTVITFLGFVVVGEVLGLESSSDMPVKGKEVAEDQIP